MPLKPVFTDKHKNYPIYVYFEELSEESVHQLPDTNKEIHILVSNKDSYINCFSCVCNNCPLNSLFDCYNPIPFLRKYPFIAENYPEYLL